MNTINTVASGVISPKSATSGSNIEIYLGELPLQRRVLVSLKYRKGHSPLRQNSAGSSKILVQATSSIHIGVAKGFPDVLLTVISLKNTVQQCWEYTTHASPSLDAPELL